MRKHMIFGLLFAAWSVSALAQAPVEITSEPSHHLVLENAAVRVFAVTVNPGASTLMHRHAHDYIAVTLGDAEILNAKAGAEPVTVAFKDGDTRFSAGGLVHAVTDKGGQPFRNVTIELLGPTTGEHACTGSCSQSPPCDSADKAACPSADELLASDQWTVTRVTLPPGSHVPRHTHTADYLVVPLSNLDLKEQAESGAVANVHLGVGEVTWNKPVTHEVTNAGSQPASLVILEFKGKPASAAPASSGPKTE